MKASHLKRNIQVHVSSGLLGYFNTLTTWTKTCSAAESYGLVAESWVRLHKRVTRLEGPFEYVWTREATKRGYAHLHVLTSCELDEDWLREAWRDASGGSWVVDAQPVASVKAANYLAKYVVSQATDRPRGPDGRVSKLRIFGKSKGVKFEPFTAPAEEGKALVFGVPWRSLRSMVPADGIQLEKVFGAPWLVVDRASVGTVMPAVIASLDEMKLGGVA